MRKIDFNVEIQSKKNAKSKRWLVHIFLISLVLSLVFALLSQIILDKANLFFAVCLIIILIFVSVVADFVGVAVTACSIRPLLEQVERKTFGAKMALSIVKKADKTSSICSDVIGDICSILSGAGGVSITMQIVSSFPSVSYLVLSLLINALLASLSIVGKAVGKTYALNNSLKIVLRVGKCFSFFHRKRER